MTSASKAAVLKAAKLERFFGRPLHETSNIVRMIALLESEPPGWLEGISRYADLPRVKIKDHPHVIPCGLITQSEIARRCQWIIENLSGKWHLSEAGFCFADSNDAVHFRLRWY